MSPSADRSPFPQEQRKAGLQVQQNPLTYEQFVQQQNDLIDKSTLPAAEKARLKAEARNSLAYTAELSRAQQDPEGVARRPTPTFSPDVNAAIDKAAAAIGLAPAVMRRFAQIESSGNPGAATGSYKGLFQMSEAVVLPSISETFGLVLLEAWAAGTTVLASGTSGARALVRHGENGWLFNLDEPATFHEAARIVLTNSQARANAAAAGQRMTLERYDLAVIGRAVRKLYEELIDAKACAT